MAPPVIGGLEEWRERRAEERKAAGDRWIEGVWVFATWKGSNRG